MITQNLRAKFPDAPLEVAKLFADHGYRDSKHVVNLFHGMDNAVEVLTSLTKLSERELLKSLGLDARPDCSGVTLHAPCHVGGTLKPDDERSFAEARASPELDLPDHASLVDKYGPPRNQGAVGSCTAFGTVATLECQLDDPSVDLSERFVYWGTKQIDGLPDSEGSYLRYSTQWLLDRGACLEATCPYVEDRDELKRRPSDAAFEESRRYRPKSRSVLPARDLGRIKAELAAGRAVGLSVPIYKSHYANLRFHSEGRWTMPLGVFDRIVGGHAICGVAYLDDQWLTANGFETENGGGCVLIRNSWGEWARNNELAHHFGASCGYGIVPYRFIEEHCWEAVSVTFSNVSTLQRHVTRFRDDATRKVAAAGSSWWQDTRGRVVAQARERLYGVD